MRRIQRRLASPYSPTADLYFANACSGLIEADPTARWRSATVLETGRAVVVFRHDAGAWLEAGERRTVVYVIDDAVFAGPRDGSLPLWYRAKLALVECEAARRILPRADVVVASSGAVLDSLPARLMRGSRSLSVLGPYWGGQAADLGHFDRTDEIRIGYLGSSVHVRGARFVCGLIEALGARGMRVSFSIAANHRVPASIGKSCRLRPLDFTRWPDYRARIGAERFHLCLYPLPETPFNAGRSCSKLVEHALVGAAPVYSRWWGERQGVTHRADGALVADTPADWIAELQELAGDPQLLRRMAAGAGALADGLNNPNAQRAFWARVLG